MSFNVVLAKAEEPLSHCENVKLLRHYVIQIAKTIKDVGRLPPSMCLGYRPVKQAING